MNKLGPSTLIIVSLLFGIVPVLLAVGSSYLKISIVIGVLKNGLGLQQVPSGIVNMALSLALTFFVMSPIVEKSFSALPAEVVNNLANAGTKGNFEKLLPAITPWRDFLMENSGEHERQELLGLTDLKNKSSAAARSASAQESIQDMPRQTISLGVLVPAFMLTELKEAFTMGFMLLIPFLVVDIVVSNILVGLGMYMLSPVLISLPIKLILFVAADGWLILSKALLLSYVQG